FTSSLTIARSATAWPAARMRSISVAPDLSSAVSRVSDTVRTAIFSGTNCRLSSMPGIRTLFELPERFRRAFISRTRHSRAKYSCWSLGTHRLQISAVDEIFGSRQWRRKQAGLGHHDNDL